MDRPNAPGLSARYSTLGRIDLYHVLEREYERVSRDIEGLSQSLSQLVDRPTCKREVTVTPDTPARLPGPIPRVDMPLKPTTGQMGNGGPSMRHMYTQDRRPLQKDDPSNQHDLGIGVSAGQLQTGDSHRMRQMLWPEQDIWDSPRVLPFRVEDRKEFSFPQRPHGTDDGQPRMESTAMSSMTNKPRLFDPMTHRYEKDLRETGQADPAGCLSNMKPEKHDPNRQHTSVSFIEPPRSYDQRLPYTMGIGSSSPVKKLLHAGHPEVNGVKQECGDSESFRIKGQPINQLNGNIKAGQPVGPSVDIGHTTWSTVEEEVPNCMTQKKPEGAKMIGPGKSSVPITDKVERTNELKPKESDGGTKRPIIKPDRYDGKGPWKPYLKHFEMCATINGWDEKDKCQYLAVLLTGSAQQTLGSLQAELKDYKQLVKSLECRFDPSGRKELHRAQLRNRRQKQSESLVELAEEIRRLVDQVYSDLPEDSRDRMGRDHFLDTLYDGEIRTRIIQMRTSTLDETGRKHTNADAMSRIPCNQCQHPCGTESKYDHSSDYETPAQDLGQAEEADDAGTEQAQPVQITEISSARCQAASKVSANWLEGRTKTELRECQRRDPVLGKIMQWLETRNVPPAWEEVSIEGVTLKTLWGAWKQLCLQDGVLYRRWEDDTGKEVRYLLVVPPELQREVLCQLHNSPTGGHLGITKLYEKTKHRFYWPKMRDSVRDWARECLECAKQKLPTKTKRAPLQQQIFGVPMERIAIDITGPFPETDTGNRYIVVISDYFTKWTEAYPIASITADVVADVLVNEFISRFGTPRLLHSDQGRQFESELFQKTCQLLGIDKTRTTPYHPQSDGQVERFNRTLKVMLSSYTSEDQKGWDRHIPAIMMAYRASLQESTGLTPNLMMLGREVELPIDVTCGSSLSGDLMKAPEYVIDLESRLKVAHEKARAHLKKSAYYQRRQYDHKITNEKYTVGAAVMMRVNARKVGVSPKLQPKFDGPLLITKTLSDVVVRVQKSPKHKPKVVHINLLKPFHGEVDRSWLNINIQASSAGLVPGVPGSPSETSEEVKNGLSETVNEQAISECDNESGEDNDPAIEETSDQPQPTDAEKGDQSASPKAATGSDEPQCTRRRRKPPCRYGDWYT